MALGIVSILLAVGMKAGLGKRKCVEMMAEVQTYVREDLAEYLET